MNNINDLPVPKSIIKLLDSSREDRKVGLILIKELLTFEEFKACFSIPELSSGGYLLMTNKEIPLLIGKVEWTRFENQRIYIGAKHFFFFDPPHKTYPEDEKSEF